MLPEIGEQKPAPECIFSKAINSGTISQYLFVEFQDCLEKAIIYQMLCHVESCLFVWCRPCVISHRCKQDREVFRLALKRGP